MEDGEKENNRDVEMAFVPGYAHEHFIPRGYCDLVCAFSELENGETKKEHRKKSLRKLGGLMIFYFVVLVVQVAGGLKANSLSVLADAAHMLADVVGLLISVWASGWKATSNYSFGFNRLKVLGALFSLQLFWLLSGLLIYQSVRPAPSQRRGSER